MERRDSSRLVRRQPLNLERVFPRVIISVKAEVYNLTLLLPRGHC